MPQQVVIAWRKGHFNPDTTGISVYVCKDIEFTGFWMVMHDAVQFEPSYVKPEAFGKLGLNMEHAEQFYTMPPVGRHLSEYQRHTGNRR